jgi:hypothetical protein
MDCPWCKDPQSEEEDGLCRMHTAEYLGMTQAQLEEFDDIMED